MTVSDIHRRVASYYTEKLHQHGPTPRGVDWNSEASQSLRFDQLLKVTEADPMFSLNEIGCGYGALVDHLQRRGAPFDYFGVDLSAEMIAAAPKSSPSVAFAVSDIPNTPRDYCVASGIFNVKFEIPNPDWLTYFRATLDVMNEFGARGFAFNALTRYSDAEKMRDYLYYADPLAIFDYCKQRYSRNVALLHDYGLYEFTILVRKNVT